MAFKELLGTDIGPLDIIAEYDTEILSNLFSDIYHETQNDLYNSSEFLLSQKEPVTV